MRVALGADHGGFRLKEIIKKHLESQGFEVEDYGTNSLEPVDYPDYAVRVGKTVAAGEAVFGILVCGTGNGMAMAANKVPGIRAALCVDGYTAGMARRHNDANVLALGERVIGEGVALEVVDIFLASCFEQGRHRARVGKIELAAMSSNN
ncbi:MAG: ribose 5-phosphate isomerase B [Peptococcaceae bacterium]|nr:ribose 5-phosphate isomerase B [Peptococcaceae bacterium]